MTYVEVVVADNAYHGFDPLTYCSASPLLVGAIVTVPLRDKNVLGVVVGDTQKPHFNTRHIIAIADLPPVPREIITLIFWMRDFYACTLGAAAQQCLPKSLPKKPVEAMHFHESNLPALPPLTEDQEQALSQIQGPGMHLLHGATGSGKTRVYIELAQRSLVTGKSAIILTPEISLTSQLEQNFKAAFGSRVLVIHSQLSASKLLKQWVAILKTAEPLVILGPRSALFAPIRDLGFIAVDEAHETAYKQDSVPYYHASRVASKLAELHQAPIVLGSATPQIVDYFLAEHKARPIIRMSQTAATTSPNESEVSIIDLRARDMFTRQPYLSNVLIEAMRANLAKGEQTLLFLNRRGTARVIFCEKCGWQATCPHCDIPLVYHGDTHSMRCHSCNFNASSPVGCPACHSPSIIFKSIGTKAITEIVSRLFPDAHIKRFDNDNTKAERIEQQYETVQAGKVDILIGTQTLAKGLDLPKLSLVGVLIADTSLFFPDFSAQERTFQLLSQVIGRVGRGHRAGKAIIQTYNPTSPLLKAAIEKDWTHFYTTELAERKAFLFPPFCHLLKLTCRRATEATAIRAAESVRNTITRDFKQVFVEGPAPAFHEKVAGAFQWQLIIKAKRRTDLLKIIQTLPSGWSYDIDPMNLL